MSAVRPIQGACNCGRNVYVVSVPQDATEQALVYFDDSSESSEIPMSLAFPPERNSLLRQDEVKQPHLQHGFVCR